MLLSQYALPLSMAYAQGGETQERDVAELPDWVKAIENGDDKKVGLEIKVPPSEKLRRPNRSISMKMLDLRRVPSEHELREAGSMGGALSPTYSADVDKLIADGGNATQVKRLMAMNMAYGRAINERTKRNFPLAAQMFRDYLEEFPDSPWAAEADLGLAFDAQRGGRLEEAQRRYQEILQVTSSDPKDPSNEMHQKAKIGWADMDMMLGNWDQAKTKLQDIYETDADWRNRTWAMACLQQVLQYSKKLEIAQACGTKALSLVMVSLGKNDAAETLEIMSPPRKEGFSLQELAVLSAKHKVKMRGFKASMAQLQNLPLPLIIHFGDKTAGAPKALVSKPDNAVTASVKESNLALPRPSAPTPQRAKKLGAVYKIRAVNHFLVVRSINKAAQTLRIFDPLTERTHTMSFVQFEREWSGFGLAVDRGTAKAQVSYASLWLPASTMQRIRGACCCIPSSPGTGGPSDEPGDDCGPSGPNPCKGAPAQGSPAVEISRLTRNMYVVDTPLWYDTPIGPDVAISMSFNSRDGLNRSVAFGNKWLFNYGTYIVENTDRAVTVFMPSGRQDLYVLNEAGTAYVAPVGVFNKFVKTGANHYELTFPGGDKFIYDIPAGTSSLQPFLVQVQDRWGYSLQMGYNASIQLTTITDAQGKVTTLSYDIYGHITKAQDPNGRLANFSYDVNGNLLLATDMEGNPFGYTYDSDVRITRITTVQGDWQYAYSHAMAPSPEDSITVTDPLGAQEKYQYQASGMTSLLTYRNRRQMPAGPRYTQAVSNTIVGGRGKMTADIYQDGSSKTYAYDPGTGMPTRITTGISADNPQGHSSYFTYNFMGNMTSATDPLGNITYYNYHANGIDLLNVVNAKGETTVSAVYNAHHMPTSITVDPANPDVNKRYTTTIVYKPWGAVATITDALTKVTTYNYDSPVDANALSGTKRLTSISRLNDASATVALASYTYDAKGRVRTVSDTYGLSQTYEYNDLDKPVTVTFSGGTAIVTDYACCNLPAMVQDRAGRKTYYDYDLMKRLIRVQDASGNTVQNDYDVNGNLAAITDTKGGTTRFKYDEWDRLVRKTYLGGSWEGYTYDAEGQLASYRNQSGAVTKYEYDDAGNVTKIDYPNSADISYSYDELDQLVGMIDESGTSVYTYNVLGQMTSDDGPLPSDTLAYTYDGLGRRKTMTVNAADTVTYSYDALRRLSTINSPPGLHTYTYNGNTELLGSLTRPNGTKTNYSFDALERLTSIQSLKSDNVTNISKYNYAFDNTTHKEGRISMERQYQATTLQHINYGYDNTSQLTSALSTETPTALENFTYSYDAMGNHNQWKKGGGSTVTGGITKTYTNNNLNQVTNLSTATNTAGTVTTDTLAMSYDLQGGLNVSYPSNGTTYSILIYDDANRLKQVLYRLKSTDALTKQVLYTYDGANRKRRTIEEDWNGTAWTPVSDKRYVYDGMNVLQERNGTGTTVVAKHVWGQSMDGGIGDLLSRTEVATSANYFYHYDGSGNVMQLTDSAQAIAARYDYDPWGVTQTTSGSYSSQPYRWSTKEQDAVTGLYYYGFRFYSSSLRTWINRDPIGEDGGLNLYAMVGNNPVNESDPDGLKPRTGSGAGQIINTSPKGSGSLLGLFDTGGAGTGKPRTVWKLWVPPQYETNPKNADIDYIKPNLPGIPWKHLFPNKGGTWSCRPYFMPGVILRPFYVPNWARGPAKTRAATEGIDPKTGLPQDMAGSPPSPVKTMPFDMALKWGYLRPRR